MKHWLSRLGYLPLAILACALGPAPFSPEPHLLEKLRLLRQGAPLRPVDVFDIFFHLAPALLLLAKLALERPWRR